MAVPKLTGKPRETRPKADVTTRIVIAPREELIPERDKHRLESIMVGGQRVVAPKGALGVVR